MRNTKVEILISCNSEPQRIGYLVDLCMELQVPLIALIPHPAVHGAFTLSPCCYSADPMAAQTALYTLVSVRSLRTGPTGVSAEAPAERTLAEGKSQLVHYPTVRVDSGAGVEDEDLDDSCSWEGSDHDSTSCHTEATLPTSSPFVESDMPPSPWVTVPPAPADSSPKGSSLTAAWAKFLGSRGPCTTTKRFNQAQDVALLLQTSGSTGTKKLVPYTLEAVVLGSMCIAASMGLSETDVCCNMMPLFHAGGIFRNVLAPLLSAGTTVCLPFFDALQFWELLPKKVGKCDPHASPKYDAVFVYISMQSYRKPATRL